MKNQNTKIIVKRILTFFMLICLIKIVDAQEQSCRTWLKSARDYRAEGKYNEAINMYNKVIKQCPDYNNIVDKEKKECQNKLKGNSNKTNPKKTSGGYVPQEQQESGRVIYEDMIEVLEDRAGTVYFAEAALLYGNNNMKEALPLLEQAYNYTPDNPEVVYHLARTYHELDELYKAKEFYEIILEKHQYSTRYQEAETYLGYVNEALKNATPTPAGAE